MGVVRCCLACEEGKHRECWGSTTEGKPCACRVCWKEVVPQESPEDLVNRVSVIRITCENGHNDKLTMLGMGPVEAENYCAILDGTHPMYVASPRSDPHSWIGKCRTCGALYRARLEEL